MPKKPSILGTWRITHMDEWDQEFVDAEVEGYVRIESDGDGEFQFGYVWGQMTCEFTQRDGKTAVEWSWEGNDEMDPASGRGWAVLQDDGTLTGRIIFHGGDKSDFTAIKKVGPRKRVEKKIRIVRLKSKKPEGRR
jgi:hypothetical protein